MIIDGDTITAATLLIVDDDRDIRHALAEGIELPGITLSVMEAGTAEEALRLVQDAVPDIMILDFNLPDMSGFDVAKVIRLVPALRSLPIIMLTAQDTAQNKWSSLDNGIDSFVGKPFDLADVEAHLYSLLSQIQQGGRRGRPV